MGLIGIIIASLVNIFLKSSMMYFFIISIIGVLVFVGLTAYDTQKIKNMYLASDSGELIGKKAVMGALTLYLDFINLFIMLLRLFLVKEGNQITNFNFNQFLFLIKLSKFSDLSTINPFLSLRR